MLLVRDNTNHKLFDNKDLEERSMVVTSDGRVGMVTTKGQVWIRPDCEVIINDPRTD